MTWYSKRKYKCHIFNDKGPNNVSYFFFEQIRQKTWCKLKKKRELNTGKDYAKVWIIFLESRR